MPPRANRQGASPNPTGTTPKARRTAGIQQVKLPALQGAPSARRQYTYGAAVEPPPSRGFGADQTDIPLNLENALKFALERQQKEREADRIEIIKAPPTKPPAPASVPKPRVRKQRRELDAEDELATAAFPPPQRGTSAAPSDMDDARSFGLESDVYGDATIASTPDLTSELNERTPQQDGKSQTAAMAATNRRRTAKGPKDQAYRQTGDSDSSDDELTTRHGSRRKKPARASEQESEDESEPAMPPPRIRVQSAPEETSTPEKPSARKPPARRRQPTKTAKDEEEQRQRAEEERSRLAAEKKAEAARKHAAKRATLKEQQTPVRDYPSDYSEQDSAIQEQILAREDALAATLAKQARNERWRQRLENLSPSKFLRRRREPRHETDDEDDTDHSATGGWRRAFDSNAYSNAYSRLSTSVGDTASATSRLAGRYMPSLYTFISLLLGTLAVLAFYPLIQSQSSHEGLFEDSLSSGRWTSGPLAKLKGLSGSIGSIIPVITRPFQTNWDDIFDLSDFDTNGKVHIDQFIKRYGQQFDAFKQAGLLHGTAIKQLEKVVPRVVHMRLENGKPVVAQEFWHALRDLIQADDGVLTLQKGGDLSDKQWQAISQKLIGDAGFTSKVTDSVTDAERRLNSRMSGLWDSWVTDNEGKLQTILGDSVEKLRTVGTGKELDERLGRIVAQQAKDGRLFDGVVVTRDEYLRHLKNELATHRSEIKAELNEIQPHLQAMIREQLETLNVGAKTAGDSVSRAEMGTLVNEAVRKAIANANLQAAASGKIHAHWETVLKNQLNHFGVGSGATINAKLSSTTYDPYSKGVVKRDELKKNGLRGARRWDHTEALGRWDEDGDKWCASRDLNADGQLHGYRLAVQFAQQVIPQQIVIEHILPGATIDPDARPREIEIYAEIEDPDVRERVLDFSATHLPESQDTSEPIVPLPSAMVRIGRFTYEGAELHDGVHVHQLSSDLIKIGAETSTIVIRAVSNYGAPDHTCFYRVRMFGVSSQAQVLVDQQAKDAAGGSWWGRFITS